MPHIPKWFKKYLERSQMSFNIILMVALMTGFTSFGLPQPPKIIKDLITNNPWFKWILLWLLIYQGGSNQDILVTNIAFIIIFILYNLNWKDTIFYIKTNKQYLVLVSLIISMYYFL